MVGAGYAIAARWPQPAAMVAGLSIAALGIGEFLTALIITADSIRWARQAATTMTGFATSVIGCGCEAGIDRALTPKETPDGRPGVRVLLFAVSTAELQKQLQARVGQCVLTSPGSACYAGISAAETLRLGDALRYFADGWQISKRLGSRRCRCGEEALHAERVLALAERASGQARARAL